MWKGFAVRNERYRLVENSLYDMKNDPSQTEGVSEKNPEMVQAMRAAYEKFWKEARPLMVNEDVPMSPTRPLSSFVRGAIGEGGIPDWKSPKL